MTQVSATARAAAVEPALRAAAAATGVEFTQLLATAQRESSLNPRARAPTSSASGLFQFIESTWLDMVRRHGARHGLAGAAAQIEVRNGRSVVADPTQRQAILDLRFDPDVAARMAGELTRENAAQLQARLGRAPTGGEVYAAHVLGPAGAGRLIDAAARGAPDASALFPREAAANRALFFTAAGEPRDAAGLLGRLSQTLGTVAPVVARAAAPPPIAAAGLVLAQLLAADGPAPDVDDILWRIAQDRPDQS